MKLRIENNSIRIRLKQNEVAMVAETGLIESRLTAGGSDFAYSLRAIPTAAGISARFAAGSLEVAAPQSMVRKWAGSSDVAMEGAEPGGLTILIEKDFQCLHKDDSANADAFPNPLARPL